MKFSTAVLSSAVAVAMQATKASSSQCDGECVCTCGDPGEPPCLYNLVPFIEDVHVATENFRKNDCALIEGSLGNEICEMPSSYKGNLERTLLKFSTGVWNKG